MAKRQPSRPRPTKKAEPFDRFESLTKRLVSVPKKEIAKARDRARDRAASDD